MPGTGDVIGAYEAPGIIRSGIEKIGEEGLSEKAKGVGIAALGTMGMIPLAGKPARAAAKVFSKIDTPVYHFTVNPGFTKFDKEKLAIYDLGPHVGSTPKGAADRMVMQVGDVEKGGSIPLKADLSKPLLNPNTKKPFTEEELMDFKVIKLKSKLGDSFTKDDLLLETDNFDVKEIRKAVSEVSQDLAKEGFTHIPYYNAYEDIGELSYEMLVDRPKGSTKVLQSPFAKKDPDKFDDADFMMEEGGVVEYEPTSTDLIDKALFSPEMVYSDAKKEWNKGNYSESIAKYGIGIYADTPVLRQALSAINNAVKRAQRDYGKEPSFDKFVNTLKNLMVDDKGVPHMLSKAEGGVVSMKDKAVNMNRGPRGIEPFVQYFENGGIVQSIKDYIGSFFEDDEEPAVKTEEPDYELPKTSVPYGIRRAEEGRFKDMIFQGPDEFNKRFKQKGVYDYKNPFDPTLKENIDRYYVLPDDPYVKPPPSAPTYRSGVEFGDTETGFDLLNKMKFNPVLQAGLRDNRSLTDYVKYLKEEYPYGREIMGRAAGFYTPSDNIIYMRQKQRMKPFGDTVQLYNFNDKSEATLVHELMHKGAELLRRDKRVDLSFLKNQLESGAPVRRNESKEIKAEHRYLQAIVNTAYMDDLLEKAGAEQTYLEGRLFERLKNAPDEATAKLIKNEIGSRRFYKEREKKMALLSEANRVYDLYFEPSMRGPFAETIKENFDIDIASGQFLYDFKKLDSLSLDDVKSIFNITNSVMAQDQATKQYKEQIEKGRVSRLTKAYPYYFPKQIDSYRRDEIDDLIREDLIKEKKAEGGVIGLKDKAVNMYRNRL
jgi:hypothetical protein